MENITACINRKINSILGRNLLENVIIDSIIVTEQVNQSFKKERLILLESKNAFSPVPGVKHYSYRIDKQQGDGGPGRQRHVHLYYNGKELFAMNIDASAHDGYHQVEIPKELNPFLVSKGFPIPSNNIIELRQYNSIGQLLCEDMNVAALNNIAFNITEAIKHARCITIFEANVDTYQIRWHSKIRNKYNHVNKLVDIPQSYITSIRYILVDFLKSTGKYSGDVSDIFDDSNSLHRLYVAWS